MRHSATLAGVCIMLSAAAFADMEVSMQTPVAKVLDCMRANNPDTLTIQELSIRPQENGRDLPALSARLYARRTPAGLRAMLHLTAPQDLAGTRYLLVETEPEDEFHVYLPSVGAARRVQGGGEDGEIAGTRLSYADLRLINQAVGGAAITLEAAQTIHGRAADVLRFSTPGSLSIYQRVFVSVDSETCATLRVEMHDSLGLAKRYEADASSLRRSGRYAYFERASIDDLRRKTRAAITLRGVQPQRAISSRVLDPRSFHKSN